MTTVGQAEATTPFPLDLDYGTITPIIVDEPQNL